MRLSKQSARRRRGFTLIELLVVIAIIVVLVGLAAGAFFKIEQSQNQKRTEATIKKVATGFQSQWNSVIDDVKNEIKNGYPPLAAVSPTNQQNLLTIAGGDRDRANALYMKMRLKQEFPQTFVEARNAITLRTPTDTTGASQVQLPAKPYYTQALTGAPTSTNTTKMPEPVWESAICLYLALTESRRGAGFNADDIGAGSTTLLSSSSPVQLKYFTDGWGYPIGLERWPASLQTAQTLYGINPKDYPYGLQVLQSSVLQELSKAPYASPVVAGSKNMDNQDPLSKLFGWSALYLASGYTSTNAMYAVDVQLHTFDGSNRTPVIYSAGGDHQYAMTISPWQGPPTPSTPNPPNVSTDDIYSFRLLIEGRTGN